MSKLFKLHPDNPQPRLVTQAVAVLRAGGLVAYPTDSSYALGCCIDNKAAMDAMRRIRRLGPDHHFTLVCRDLAELATFGRVDNRVFRLLRASTPGPFTFLLPATRDVPRRLQNPKRRAVGLRVPDHVVARALVEALGEPVMSTTLIMPGETLPLADADDIIERVGGQIDAVIDAGPCGVEPTTVVDLTGEVPRVTRRGRGDPAAFES